MAVRVINSIMNSSKSCDNDGDDNECECMAVVDSD